MSIVLPVFTPIEETLYLTLCGRALDNHLPDPILADPVAEQLVRKLDYDCGRFRLSASPIINIAHRAKKLDEIARRFITRHPDAVGLDLGAGLDTRVFRLDPPAGVDWYDVDFPEVIAARRQLVPERAHAHGVGADLTDPDWLDAIPGDRPAVIVADGLMAFLTQDDMIALVNRLIGLVFWIIEKIFKIVAVIPFLKTFNALLGGLLGFLEGIVVVGGTLYIAARYPISASFGSVLAASHVGIWLLHAFGLFAPLLPQAVRQLQAVI